ncbi:MAG: succinate dehydrogenase, cytochrome b556 subunit [Burkholderiaceae bacterium]
MSDASGKIRPQHRNIGVGDILKYRLPLAGIASILHRISGVLLFLIGIPLILYMLQLSLTSEVSYAAFESMVDSIFVKLILLLLLWAFFHHLCAGIRYLLLDLHVGIQKETSALTAKIVLGASLALTFIAMLKLFGAF